LTSALMTTNNNIMKFLISLRKYKHTVEKIKKLSIVK